MLFIFNLHFGTLFIFYSIFVIRLVGEEFDFRLFSNCSNVCINCSSRKKQFKMLNFANTVISFIFEFNTDLIQREASH